MRIRIATALLLVFLSTAIHGQGIVICDQQSSVEGVWGEGGGYIEPNQPMGQSFIPELDSVGFIRLDVFAHGSGGTVYVNLLADSITGPVIGRSDSVSVPSGAGPVNFIFSTPAAVTPGVTYYFQPVGDNNTLAVIGDTGMYYSYARGTAFAKGVAGPQDLWFREGIYVVPEPSPVWLLLLGSTVFGFRAQRRGVRTPSER